MASVVLCEDVVQPEGEAMAKLTEEQIRQRAQRAALDAEAEDRRRREQQERWKREGRRLSYAEYVAGEPCRDCGEPMPDDRGDWPPLMKMSDAEKQERDEAERRSRERHADCRDGRWTINGSRVTHCGSCCPPPPMSPKQIEGVARIPASGPSREERKKDLGTWSLALRCEHVVPYIQHREHSYVSTSDVDCPAYGERREVVSSERVGPTNTDSGTLRARAVADRACLTGELAAAEAKLARQQKNTAATQRHIAEIQEALSEKS
ncbi:hypothetical protein ACFWY6_30080 [Streptomyces sp. NPDC059037]|uniref:hypothetical protein n=1 Tax=Streptomyces sp. NPDC059037 TaxID=3346710 RepID=UPI0036B58C52